MEQNPPVKYDVVIIGGGPGGYAAALYGASAGLKIAIAIPSQAPISTPAASGRA